MQCPFRSETCEEINGIPWNCDICAIAVEHEDDSLITEGEVENEADRH